MKKKAKKQPRRTSAMYLTRDAGAWSWYNIHAHLPRFKPLAKEWIGPGGSQAVTSMCHKGFESVMPKKFHLEPGGGPLKIKLELG